MRRAANAGAIALLLLAVLLPAQATAAALSGSEGDAPARVLTGVWLFKGLIALHAALLLGGSRLRFRPGPGGPLLDRGVRSPSPASAREVGLLLALLALALILRLVALGEGLWFDEIDTLVHHVRLPLGELLTTFESKNQHLFYSVLARLAFELFGESAWALRLPAALLGVLGVWATWRFARSIAPPFEAGCAAALLACSYHHVWFSQNARGYTGLLLFTVVGSECFLRMLSAREERGLHLAWAYGAASAGAMWMHSTALMAIAAHGAIWLVLLARRGKGAGSLRWLPGAGFLLCATLSLLLYALVLPSFLGTVTAPTMAGRDLAWKSPLWLLSETLSGLARGMPGGTPGLAIGAGLGLAVGLLGLSSYARQGLAVLAILLLPACFTLAVLLASGHNLWPRFFFSSAPFFVLIVLRGLAAGVERFTRSPRLAPLCSALRIVVLGLFCLASAATVPAAWGPKQDFQGAIEFLEAHAGPRDAVVTFDMSALPMRELYGKPWPQVDTLAELGAVERDHPRTWLVLCTPDPRMQALFPTLREHFSRAYVRARAFPGTVGGSEVVVLESR